MLPALPLLFFFQSPSPQQRAINFLIDEVPKWSRENRCYSCHNNGDAARSLYLARARGYAVPQSALADTEEWLLHPKQWDDNHGNPAFSDKKLARIQFTAALAESYRYGSTKNRDALIAAADLLTQQQEKNGSWLVDTGGMPGAPATYGTAIATYMAQRALTIADSARFMPSIRLANKWLSSFTPMNIPDAAAMLLGSPRSTIALKFILDAQNPDGGWGPQRNAPSEAFDTALVLLALADGSHEQKVADARRFLLKSQDSSGGWPETTRPPGQTTYAERISTSGWATYALLMTDTKR